MAAAGLNTLLQRQAESSDPHLPAFAAFGP
jgi:hypothetical protein